MLTSISLKALTKWLAKHENQIADDCKTNGDMADLRIVFRQTFNRWPQESK